MDNKKLKRRLLRLIKENKLLKRQIWYDLSTAISKTEKERREVIKK